MLQFPCGGVDLEKKKYVLKPRPVPQKIFTDLDNEQQNAVVNSSGRSIVIAGPGSGKTRVVTYKIVHLISQGVPPSRIMLVTFTRAAAKEMIERAKVATGRDLEEMVAGTFHSVCNLFLRKYATRLGYESNYTILDRDDSKTMMKHARAIVLERLPKELRKNIPKEGLLLHIHSYMMNTLSNFEKALKDLAPYFMEISSIIAEIFAEYNLEKKKQNTMDYDDLLVNFLRLLKEYPKIAERLSERFEWILVDEFQDTNIVQYYIVEELAKVHGNIFVVGDDAQSIYSFRGARFENVMDFMKIEGTKVFKIQTNYRSTGNIVKLVNALLPRSAVPKILRATREGGVKPVVVTTMDSRDQAMFVGQRIEELLEEGVPPREIAVLYRSNYMSLDIQLDLSARSIPFRVLAGRSFLELAHIKDVLAFLRIVQNPKDVVSWVRAAKLFEGVGDRTASKLAQLASKYVDSGLDYTEAIKQVRASRKTTLSKMEEILSEIKEMSSPEEMINTVLSHFYSDYLLMRYEDAYEREKDLEKLSELASRYNSLERFLSDLSLTEEISPEIYEDKEKVTLTTIHQAKGLEWNTVFVVSVNPGDLPNAKAIQEGHLDEEERLFYVAITRAKERLYIIKQALGTAMPYVGNSIRFARDLDFIERIPEDLVEFWEV